MGNNNTRLEMDIYFSSMDGDEPTVKKSVKEVFDFINDNFDGNFDDFINDNFDRNIGENMDSFSFEDFDEKFDDFVLEGSILMLVFEFSLYINDEKLNTLKVSQLIPNHNYIDISCDKPSYFQYQEDNSGDFDIILRDNILYINSRVSTKYKLNETQVQFFKENLNYLKKIINFINEYT